MEMASREFAELEVIGAIATVKDVAVGIVDVKSYWIEPVEEIAQRVRRCAALAGAAGGDTRLACLNDNVPASSPWSVR